MFCQGTLVFIVFFFFQAEDGIRDVAVTGVQTCALPIYGTHCVQHRRPDLNPEMPVDDVLDGGIDLELLEHLTHGCTEVCPRQAGYVRRRYGEQEFFGPRPGPGGQLLHPSSSSALDHAVGVEQHPVEPHGSAAYAVSNCSARWRSLRADRAVDPAYFVVTQGRKSMSPRSSSPRRARSGPIAPLAGARSARIALLIPPTS